MQVSTPNTFPLVLFKVLTPAQHQSKRKCHYTYWLFCQKSQQIQEIWISYSTGWTYKMNLPTENRKWWNSSALSAAKNMEKFFSSEKTTLNFMFSLQIFPVRQWLSKFACSGHTWLAHFRAATEQRRHTLIMASFLTPSTVTSNTVKLLLVCSVLCGSTFAWNIVSNMKGCTSTATKSTLLFWTCWEKQKQS